jgi:hypothetical protein
MDGAAIPLDRVSITKVVHTAVQRIHIGAARVLTNKKRPREGAKARLTL